MLTLLWILLTPLALLVFLLVAGLSYQAVGAWRDRRRYPAPGRLVEVLGEELHYVDQGQGEPVVVLEAGISASSVSWSHVMPALAKHTRVIAYDRAGLAWSGRAGYARVTSRMADELHTLLEKIGVDTPVILVGHSFGGLLSLEYTCRYRQEVAGVVLVDAVPRCDWHPLSNAQARRIGHGVRLALRGALLARLGVVRLALALTMAGRRMFPKAIAKASSGRATSMIERIIGEVRKLPPETWPAIRAHWCVPKTFFSMASHLENLPGSAAAYRRDDYPVQVPITVLTAENAHPMAVAEHLGDARASLMGEHRVVPESGHWIHLDQPGEVIGAVLSMVEMHRSLRSGRAGTR